MIWESVSMDRYLQAAIEQARLGFSEGGIPIGSVLVIDNEIVGRGHNRRVQRGSAILHAEMDCLENAGRLTVADYRRSVIYSTLSPCVCDGYLVVPYPETVVGENQAFKGPEEYVQQQGVSVEIMDNSECVQLMTQFIEANPICGMRTLVNDSVHHDSLVAIEF